MMNSMKTNVKRVVAASFRRAFGLDGRPPLGAGALPVIPRQEAGEEERRSCTFLNQLADALVDGNFEQGSMLSHRWSDAAGYAFEEAGKALDLFYGSLSDSETSSLIAAFDQHQRADAATAVAEFWAPEIKGEKQEAVKHWRLRSAEPNPKPIKASEILLQLNGLYTLPETIPDELPDELKDAGKRLLAHPGAKVADYDHPVPLFQDDESHELVSCLARLEDDIAYEKSIGLLPVHHKVPILLSVSVTHEHLDEVVCAWIAYLLGKRLYHHFRLYLLTEERCRYIDRKLFGGGMPQFGVAGAYGRHFTALKYSSLLFERGWGIRASFKLDTDEGILSRNLKEATGKSWFETLCHPLWGAQAVDPKGQTVYLGVNEGEYVNSNDIDTLGYPEALRTPDVKLPASHAGRDLFFQKGFAHGNATAWYNEFDDLEELISHPVVKGGGYGITNDGIRQAAPFTWSKVGRAEDQQFYFSALSGGVRGIFHPNLRIAHYKNAVSGAEHKTESTRLAGDMYRLVQFSFLAEYFGVKEELDPMPGVFASRLARAQAFFHLIHRAAAFLMEGKGDHASFLLSEGLRSLADFEKLIDSGKALEEIEKERALWRQFINTTDTLSAGVVREVIDSCEV
ncbi:hypothetical protein Spirs_0357 [Sediminispirochaeta smaragdinae DSM 11293]|uniref:Uncharacterized protein n=2 Tax=Sediminispirochaeta TaxID=1911556 RepID=E1RAY3_SEDSS|nr:hypothetical protein Spirs_0357 [Sediminispirochaeta smaragdinae DSM 11293]